MAQLVKLEPGDILILANVGDEAFGDDSALQAFADTAKSLGIEQILIFAGGVDLSKVPTDAVGFTRLYLNDEVASQGAACASGVESGDGGE